jgi:hypothetical protein
VKIRILFYAVVTPLAAIGRPFWHRRLGLNRAPGADTYWRRRRAVVTADVLKTKP